MPSKISFFSGPIYRKHLGRFAPLWVVYLLLWLMILPLSILSQSGSVQYDLGSLQYTVLNSALHYGSYINLVYAIAISMALHAWYYRANSVNAMVALPIRREAYCMTNLLTALSFSLFPNLLVALLTWAAAASAQLPGFCLAAQWLGIQTLEFLFYYGLAACCAAIVGQILALPVLYLLVNYFAVVLNYVSVTVLSTFVYGMQDRGYTLLARLSPAFYLPSGIRIMEKSTVVGDTTVYTYLFHGWLYLVAIAIAGLVLTAAAFLLFRFRRMEAAGDVIAVRPLRPVLKYCVTVFCSLVLGVLTALTFFSGGSSPSLPSMLICLLAGGFVGYFMSEILLKKSFQVFRREWIGFGVFSLCLLAAALLMEMDAFGFERRVPAVSDVESITLDGSTFWNPAIVTEEAYIADLITLHQSIVSDKAEQEALAAQWPNGDQLDYTVIDLVYQLKNGRTLARTYRLYCTEEIWHDASSLPRQYADILQDPYIIYLENVPAFDVTAASVDYGYLNIYDMETMSYQTRTLTSSETYELYVNCILPDLQEGLVGYTSPFFFEDNSSTEYQADIFISFVHMLTGTAAAGQDRIVLDSSSMDIVPTVGSRTAAFLLEEGYDLSLRSEVLTLDS